MRWRFVDKIESFQPWRSAAGRKAVSLEEYCLYEPLGRKGVLPESLILESCVQLVRWLVAKSSQFDSTCVLSEIESFSLLGEVGMGEVVGIAVAIISRGPDRLRAECRVCRDGETVARGALSVDLLPLAEGSDPAASKTIWRELYGSS